MQCGPGARVCNARVFKRAAGWLTLLPLSRWLARTLKAGGTGVGVLCNVFNGEGAAADGAGHAARTPTRRGATPDHQALLSSDRSEGPNTGFVFFQHGLAAGAGGLGGKEKGAEVVAVGSWTT